MKKLVIGIIICFVNVAFIIIGITFAIVVPLLEVSSITETMLIVSFYGLGMGIGTILTLLGLSFIIEGINK